MLTDNLSKEVRRWIDRVRMPSGQCQACLSDKSADKDFMITCDLCQSSIHCKHYGRQIDQSVTPPYDKWRCERCRMIYLLASQQNSQAIEALRCHFCPSRRGIIKRVIYNNSETIWLHPECSTWPYPIIFQKNNRRIHYNCEFPSKLTGRFWVNLETQQKAPCLICNQSVGYKIKCMYYTCQKYYHCSCAKSIGVIRDLESMHFENSDTYIPPYCEEHMEKRIADCGVKAKKYRQLKDEGKASHFNQMMAAYQIQLKNMQKSTKKFKEEEQIRLQLEYQAGEKDDILEQMSFDDQNSFHSQHPSDFYNQIFDNDFPKTASLFKKPTLFANPHPSNDMVAEPEQPAPVDPNLQGNEVNVGSFLHVVESHQQRGLQRYSQPEESEWDNSQQFQEEDD